MATPRTELHPVSGAITGDLAVSRLVLTGWSQRAHQVAGSVGATTRVTDDGRVWLELSGTTLYVHRDGPTDDVFASSSRIASGTVSGGLVTFIEVASSGITGSADVSGSSGYVRALLTYADEISLRRYIVNATELLDGSSLWEGGVRFERALVSTFRKLNGWVTNRLVGVASRETSGRYDLTQQANPRALEDVHAMLCAEMLLRNRAAAGRTADLDLADSLAEQADREFGRIRVEIDEELDGMLEAEALGVTRLRRA